MQDQLNLFGEEMYEYFFMIKPDPKTDKEVKLYKRMINSSIRLSGENLWSVPHLSLFKWTANYSMDNYIIHKAEKALKDIQGFKVKLDGVDVYHHGPVKKSIVLKVKNPEPIRTVNKSLFHEFRFKVRKISPHISIVRSIPVDEFNKLGLTLNEFNYKGEFLCNKITILKKVMGADRHYVLLHETALN